MVGPLQNDCMIYEIIDSKTILVPMEVIEYFKREYFLLISALNFQIAKFLERINQAPKIAEEVVGDCRRWAGSNFPEVAITISDF